MPFIAFIKEHWLIIVVIAIVIIGLAIFTYYAFGFTISGYLSSGDPDSGVASQNMLDFIKSKESLQLNAYLDGEGIPTIGYGHTTASGNPPAVTMGMTITEDQADSILAADVQSANQVVTNVVTVPMTQNQRDALIDFEFGTGALPTSSLLTLVNSGDWQGASDFIANHYITGANGGSEPGLVTRAAYNAQLILG